MKVILSANIQHYLHTAQALSGAGLLQRYICAIGIKHNRPLPGLISGFWRRKLEGRRLCGIPAAQTVAIWLPELLQVALMRTRVVSKELVMLVQNLLYDGIAARYVEACDVFHFMAGVGLQSARKAKRLGAVLLCDVREEHFVFQRRVLAEEYQRLGLTAEVPGGRLLRRLKAEYAIADFFVVPSSYAKRTFVTEGVPAENVFVAPYGVDTELFRHQTKADDVFRILFVGGFIPRKGVHYLVEAFRRSGLTQSELVLVGGQGAFLDGLLDDGDKRIRRVRDVPKVELPDYYRRASVLVLPSVADAQPLVVLEAMACGLPVIVTDHCGSGDFVRDGVEGFVVPVRDVEALRARLVFLAENEVARRRMGKAAGDRIETMTWWAYGRRILEIYREIGMRTGGRA